ncbi:hypothetical protein LINPERPRIM_LOCUS20800, partial [Linum perenne]
GRLKEGSSGDLIGKKNQENKLKIEAFPSTTSLTPCQKAGGHFRWEGRFEVGPVGPAGPIRH